MSTNPVCASFLSLVVALLKPWPLASVSLPFLFSSPCSLFLQLIFTLFELARYVLSYHPHWLRSCVIYMRTKICFLCIPLSGRNLALLFLYSRFVRFPTLLVLFNLTLAQYPEDPFRMGNLSPVSTVTKSDPFLSTLPFSTNTQHLTSHAQHLFESLRGAYSQAELSRAMITLRELCVVDAFHLRCVWEISWEPYLRR